MKTKPQRTNDKLLYPLPPYLNPFLRGERGRVRGEILFENTEFFSVPSVVS
jgi:hypothetical protein